MFRIIQSNDIERLAEHLMAFYCQQADVFSPFVVITPASVLEEWLKKTIASRLGVSTLFTTQFWGQYQWQMMAQVLAVDARFLSDKGQSEQALSVPDVAVLSQAVMRWRLFGYLSHQVAMTAVADETHVLHSLLVQMADDGAIDNQRLWQWCDNIARLYTKYLTQRPDWLKRWADAQAVAVADLIAQKDEMTAYFAEVEPLFDMSSGDDGAMTIDTSTPAWLVAHYQAVEQALRFLWGELFADVYRYRLALERRFWQVLKSQDGALQNAIKAVLPKTLYLFTVQQLPQVELDFLKRLSVYADVVLLHFNPSQMFWADIVDKNWFLSQKIIRPSSVYLKDYGHGLLSRLGKESRETFAMLAHLSGGDDSQGFSVVWTDDFVNLHQNTPKKTLLSQLKNDILMLDESGLASADWSWQALKNKQYKQQDWVLDWADDSLLIHNCHSLKRQLEVARLLIGKWLNTPSAGGTPRKLSDVVVFLPDVESHRSVIEHIFGVGVGSDGLSLPARLTGVSDSDVMRLWQAMVGFYRLSDGRFYAQEVYDWLMLPPLYQSFGLNFDEMSRACQLLTAAGFVRGLDGKHLKTSLDEQDSDYRRTFAYALDALMAGFLFGDGLSGWAYPFDWQSGIPEKSQAILLNASDKPIIDALCQIYLALKKYQGKIHQTQTVLYWLDELEFDLIERCFFVHKHSEIMRCIFDAKNSLKGSILANGHYQRYGATGANRDYVNLMLPLSFVLESLENAVLSQQLASEPSGVITFGRFGALRGIPFGLVIMLDMNLSLFPRKVYDGHLDLMKAGLPRRGDRNHEDDDNGAFLEAILSAKDSCWIFYQGQTTDGKVLLPAAPVSELVQFLKNVPYVKETDDKNASWSAETIQKWLVRHHGATPFARLAFEKTKSHQAIDDILTQLKQQSPPTPLWQSVYQGFDKKTPLQPLLDLLSDNQLQHLKNAGQHLQNMADMTVAGALACVCDGLIDKTMSNQRDIAQMTTLVAILKNPARAYLQQKTAIIQKSDTPSVNEPLSLGHLQSFGVLSQLLQGADDTNSHWAYWDNVSLLPAGVARLSSLDEQKNQVAMLHDELSAIKTAHRLPIGKTPITPTQGQSVSVFERSLLVDLPSDDDGDVGIWYQLLPVKARPHQLLGAYLHHLAWQVARATACDGTFGQAGSSVWQYRMDDKTASAYGFAPILASSAKRQLCQWLVLAKLMACVPIVITPKAALDYIRVQNHADNDDTAINKALADGWLSKYDSDDSASHPYWQAMLGDNDALMTIKRHLKFLAQAWYGDWAKALVPLTKDGDCHD